MIAYLASPIDFGTIPTNLIKRAIADAGFSYYDPASAWVGHVEDADAINKVNNTALDSSDAVVCVFGSGRSIGVPMEAQRAIDRGIPVAAIGVGLIRSVPVRQFDAFFDDEVQDHPYIALSDWLRSLSKTHITDTDVKLGLVQRDKQYADGLPLPRQVKEGDIGCDLTVSRDTMIMPNRWAPIPSDISILAPSGTWFQVMGRSSALVRRGLLVIPSVIDNGFTGRLYVIAHNLDSQPVEVKRGERIAQLIPLPLTRVGFLEVDELPKTERGDSGFGSTGA